MTFQDKLEKIIEKNNSLLCIGLDSDYTKIPDKFRHHKNSQFEFNKWIIDQTYDLVCAYKPNSAFYEAEGVNGISSLKLTCDYLRTTYPFIPIILDAKRGDIGSTNAGYIKYAFEYLAVDAITLHPFLGRESLLPFLELKDKGLFFLCRTSNPGAKEFQDLKISKNPLYKHIAKTVSEKWNKYKNCMLVVGATYPKELREIRKLVKKMTLLIPGVGVQGGDLEKTVKAGVNYMGKGIIINSSRGIIFTENPQEVAYALRNKINKYR